VIANAGLSVAHRREKLGFHGTPECCKGLPGFYMALEEQLLHQEATSAAKVAGAITPGQGKQDILIAGDPVKERGKSGDHDEQPRESRTGGPKWVTIGERS
jgi:hypothetical protein